MIIAILSIYPWEYLSHLHEDRTNAIQAIVQSGLEVILSVGFMLALKWRQALILIVAAPNLVLVVL